jgi:hypothetical protein
MGLLRRLGNRQTAGRYDYFGPAIIPEMPLHAPPPVMDPGERLRRLADLRDRGLLSESEFAAQRHRVLGT